MEKYPWIGLIKDQMKPQQAPKPNTIQEEEEEENNKKA